MANDVVVGHSPHRPQATGHRDSSHAAFLGRVQRVACVVVSGSIDLLAFDPLTRHCTCTNPGPAKRCKRYYVWVYVIGCRSHLRQELSVAHQLNASGPHNQRLAVVCLSSSQSSIPTHPSPSFTPIHPSPPIHPTLSALLSSSPSSTNMPPHEQTPLLTPGNGHTAAVRFNFIKSSRHLLFGSWLNALTIFVPICLVAEYSHWSATARFVTSFIAIVPLAKVRAVSVIH